MNRYLLDTHVLLWWLEDPAGLTPNARAAIGSAGSELHVSAAAVWELSIKKSLGRLRTPEGLPAVLIENSIAVLSVNLEHALAVADLPHIHGDPFDRIQVVQARLENLTFITRDRQLEKYGVPVLRA